MGKRLGHMIREFREKQGRTIEEAARGLLRQNFRELRMVRKRLNIL